MGLCFCPPRYNDLASRAFVLQNVTRNGSKIAKTNIEARLGAPRNRPSGSCTAAVHTAPPLLPATF
jgi:hypothetical protein